MLIPYMYLQWTNNKTINYIYKEIKVLNSEYFNLIHPTLPFTRYEKYRGKLLYGKKFNIQKKFSHNDIAIFDNSAATLIHFFLENKIPFVQIISREDYNRFSNKQKKWFNILYDFDFAFYNDEIGKLTLSLMKIMKSDYKIPEKVLNFHEQTFKC